MTVTQEGTRTRVVYSGAPQIPAKDSQRIGSTEYSAGLVKPEFYCLGKCTQWQDDLSAPGWALANGSGAANILGGTLLANALEDGGFLHVTCAGDWTVGAGHGNPTLLFELQAWKDYWTGSATLTRIGPTGGWGFTNAFTGTPVADALKDGVTRRFLFDVKLHSIGQRGTNQLHADGSIKLFDEIGNDGGLVTTPDGFEYLIHSSWALDLTEEYELLLKVGLPTAAGGSETMHIHSAGMFLAGGRMGHEIRD